MCVGKLLERTYGEDYQRVVPMCPNEDYALAQTIQQLSEEQREELARRFTFCINQSALTDSGEELMEFLQGTKETLGKIHAEIGSEGKLWVDNYLCDDKNYFFDFSKYLRLAEIFGTEIHKFYLKFTNTRKHGRRMYDADGNLVLHSLEEYSPITSSEYMPGLFRIEEYGEEFEKVFGLYEDIIRKIWETYHLVGTINMQAHLMKTLPEKCKKRLDKVMEDAKNAYKSMYPGCVFPMGGDVERNIKLLPEEMVNMIYTLDLEEMYTALYHEVPNSLEFPFAVVACDRLRRQQGLTDVESVEVFAHIADPREKLNRALRARILLEHLDDFGKQICKGNMAVFVYKWTGTNMSESEFLSAYYNVVCKNEDYHVAQSTFSTAYKRLLKNGQAGYEDFLGKVDGIINAHSQPRPLAILPVEEQGMTKKVKEGVVLPDMAENSAVFAPKS